MNQEDHQLAVLMTEVAKLNLDRGRNPYEVLAERDDQIEALLIKVDVLRSLLSSTILNDVLGWVEDCGSESAWQCARTWIEARDLAVKS